MLPEKIVHRSFFILIKAEAKHTCFGPADGGVLPAFSRALDGDLVIQLQALRRLGGRGELQLL